MQLQGAYFRDAQLQGASLKGAQLQGASLDDVSLQGADLRDAQLQGASLQGAQLQGATFFRAQLQGASLVEAQLQGADFARATLFSTDLSRAKIWRTEFSDANLENVFESGLLEKPLSEDDFYILQPTVSIMIPKNSLRENTLKRMDFLSPDLKSGKEPDQSVLYGAMVDKSAYQRALGGVLKNLACSDERSIAVILLGLVKNDRIASTGSLASQVVADILACSAFSEMPADEQKMIAKEIAGAVAVKTPIEGGAAVPSSAQHDVRIVPQNTNYRKK